jgi:hypothetical protein
MVHNNKILTVSYGTFSCTLEGFDDSFGTMKAIAEYFRDLASDDRYFGAEPPQPDAEMLARIAQREISRRVEAHHDDTGIVLRATEHQHAPATLVPTTAVAPQEQAQQPDVSDEVFAEADVQAHEESKVVDATPAPVISEPVIEAPVADPVAQTVAEVAVEPTPEPVAEAQPAPEPIQAETPPVQAEAEPVQAEAEPTPQPVEQIADTVDADAALMASVQSAPEPTVEDFVAETVELADTVPAADSIAAKLQRIRAVVSRNDAQDVQPEYSEDEHADAFLSDEAREISTAMEADDVASPPLTEADEVEALLDRLDVAISADREGPAQAEADENLFDETDDEDESGDDETIGEDNILVTQAPSAPVADGGQRSPLRARVVKVKRADLDAALAKGTLEEVTQDAAADESSLSDEDEAELMRELAEVEAELTKPETDQFEDDDDLIASSAPEDTAPQIDEPAKAEPTRKAMSDDADLSRLLVEAGNKMAEPENSSRRNEITQLRAAVAATKAEDSLGNKDELTPIDEPYRADLANVVRPRRPESGAAISRRPSEAKPAPLKLVAELRVDDMPKREERGPVRPRRIASAPEPVSQFAPGDEGGFAAFAAESGAKDLPELLEAAAAYLSFVEGHDQFSRPQLMTKVRMVEQEEFSREDGLRTFGQLLREGKIEKIKGGRFTVSDRIGFKPADRAAS